MASEYCTDGGFHVGKSRLALQSSPFANGGSPCPLPCLLSGTTEPKLQDVERNGELPFPSPYPTSGTLEPKLQDVERNGRRAPTLSQCYIAALSKDSGVNFLESDPLPDNNETFRSASLDPDSFVDEGHSLNGFSEEHLLNITFEACETMGTGEVLASTVMRYLRDMTTQSPGRGRLAALYDMLDPERQDPSLSRATFHSTMRRWIAQCSQDGLDEDNYQTLGSEHVPIDGIEFPSSETEIEFPEEGDGCHCESRDLLNTLEELKLARQKLNEQNSGLLRTVSQCEDTNLQLMVEITELKTKLASAQRSALKARSLTEELEDARRALRESQERGCWGLASRRKLEQENKCLKAHINVIEETNERLSHEKLCIEGLVSKLMKTNAGIREELEETIVMMAEKDGEITKKNLFIDDLKMSYLENHKIIEGIQLELAQLQENSQQELLRLDMYATSPKGSVGRSDSVPHHCSLRSEIEEMQKRSCQETVEEASSPICGILLPRSQGEGFQQTIKHVKSKEQSLGMAHIKSSTAETLGGAFSKCQQQQASNTKHIANVERDLVLQGELREDVEGKLAELEQKLAEAHRQAQEVKRTATSHRWTALKVDDSTTELMGEAFLVSYGTEDSLREVSQAHSETQDSLREVSQSHSETQDRLREVTQAHSETQDSLREVSQSHSETQDNLREVSQAHSETQDSLREVSQSHLETQDRLREVSRQAHSETQDRLREVSQSHLETQDRLREVSQSHFEKEDRLQQAERTIQDLQNQMCHLEVALRTAQHQLAESRDSEGLENDAGKAGQACSERREEKERTHVVMATDPVPESLLESLKSVGGMAAEAEVQQTLAEARASGKAETSSPSWSPALVSPGVTPSESSTTKESRTTEELSIAEEPSTVEVPSLAEEPSTTVEPSTADTLNTTEEPSTIEEPSLAEEPSTAVEPSTADTLNTTEEPSTTEQPSTTEVSSTTEEPSTAEEPITTEQPSTTEESSTTEEPRIAEEPSTTDTADKVNTTEEPSTAEEPSTIVGPGMADKCSTTEKPMTEDIHNITEEPSTAERPCTAEEPSTREEPSNAEESRNTSPQEPERMGTQGPVCQHVNDGIDSVGAVAESRGGKKEGHSSRAACQTDIPARGSDLRESDDKATLPALETFHPIPAKSSLTERDSVCVTPPSLGPIPELCLQNHGEGHVGGFEVLADTDSCQSVPEEHGQSLAFVTLPPTDPEKAGEVPGSAHLSPGESNGPSEEIAFIAAVAAALSHESPGPRPQSRSRAPVPPTMPTLPEEDEDSPEELDSVNELTPVESRMGPVALPAPSIIFPQHAGLGDQHLRPLEQARPLSPRSRMSRNSPSQGNPITTVDSAGRLIDLVKDPLPNMQLSEQDKRKNLELLEEAKKVSHRFLTRRGRRSTSSLSESPTGLSPNPTPQSSPAPSRSCSLTAPPQFENTEVNYINHSATQLLDVPMAREPGDSRTQDSEARAVVDWKPSEKRKVSSGTLSPRHKEGPGEGMRKGPGESPERGGPRKAQDTPLPKPVAQPAAQQAPCTAQIKTIGAFPPLMRAVPWDAMGSVPARGGPPCLSIKKEEPYSASDKLGESLLKASGYKDFPVQPVKVQKLATLREEHKLTQNQSVIGSMLPELSETSEQENASPTEEESIEKSDVMPNISDILLRKLKLHRALPGGAPPLTEKEVENAFVQLSLAFRNDSYTLDTRLRHAERERNQTEDSTEKELEEFKSSLKQGSVTMWHNSEQRESYQRLVETVAVLHRLATRLSSRAEMVGAVRQEKRLNKATEVMMQYVENLKRTYEKDHAELTEFKKLANQNSSRCYGGSMDSGDDGILRGSRSMSLTLGKALPRRRVSVAVVPKFNLLNIPGQAPPTAGPTPPTMCEANSVKCTAATESAQQVVTENGKTEADQESETTAPAKTPNNPDEISPELKAKIEEDAYNKGYQEGLKRSKELQGLKEVELKEEEEKVVVAKEDPEEQEQEAPKENKTRSKYEEALDVFDRLCPKIFRRNQLFWVVLTLFALMFFVVSVFKYFSDRHGELGDVPAGKTVSPGKKKFFGWNVGLQPKNPVPE